MEQSTFPYEEESQEQRENIIPWYVWIRYPIAALGAVYWTWMIFHFDLAQHWYWWAAPGFFIAYLTGALYKHSK